MPDRPYRTTPATPPLEPRQCICGETFKPNRISQVHCSRQCRIRSYWTRYKVVPIEGGS